VSLNSAMPHSVASHLTNFSRCSCHSFADGAVEQKVRRHPLRSLSATAQRLKRRFVADFDARETPRQHRYGHRISQRRLMPS
jgi:hypothetical protein